MPRWPGSTRRSAGARHGACEDRQDSILRTTTDADGDGETPAASEADIDVGSDAARGHEDNWRNIAITLTNPQNLQSLGGVMSALLANRDARTKVNSFRICMLKVGAQIGPVMSKITGQTV